MIIGLVGGPRSGKTTAFHMMLQNLGCADEYTFAGPLKDALQCMFPSADVDSQEGKASPLGDSDRTVRDGFHTLSDWAKTYSPHVFTDLAEQYLKGHTPVPGSVGFLPLVFTDVRSLEEAAMLKRHGAHLVGFTRGRHVLDTSHYMEHEFMGIGVDTMINNNGTLEETKTQLDEMLEKL